MKRQSIVRTYPEGFRGYSGTEEANELLMLGCNVVSVQPWYNEKGVVMGNEYIIESERKEGEQK